MVVMDMLWVVGDYFKCMDGFVLLLLLFFCDFTHVYGNKLNCILVYVSGHGST